MLGTITLTVGQTDGVSVSQKEETPETMDTIQAEVTPQVNGEKEEKESPDANEIAVAEEKAAEEKPDETNEVGFKKIFRFVGFKFTLKKDKSEEKDPVKLLTIKDKEGEEDSKADATEDAKEEATPAEEEVKSEEKPLETETPAAEGDVAEVREDVTVTPTEETAAETAKGEEEADKVDAADKEAETSPPSQEVVQSPFRKFFTGGLFSNLRKKASIKKPKEEDEEKEKEKAVEEETKEIKEETAKADEEEEEKSEMKEEDSEATAEKVQPEPTPEAVVAAPEEKEEVATETPAPAEDTPEEATPAAAEEKAEDAVDEEKAPVEVTTEAELLSSQEKTKPQGSPLKKLFTGAGLKKLSTKKNKKKDTEAKLTESGEQSADQLQSSTESSEGQKPDSAVSSPEESGEFAVAAEPSQVEVSQETDGEVTSDGEKKKEGIMPWSSFKKLVTPKKRVKRSSESEDEATGEKPVKSATLSSTESAVFVEKSGEEEVKEDKPTEEEPKTENAEKLESSTEEPKKKIDTSVSWEALMCMGGTKKRTRRTSDSDDEETKLEDEPVAAAAGEEPAESPVTVSQEADNEVQTVSSPEQAASPPERESAWDTLKRLVMPKGKPKPEEKSEESPDQVLSDSEAPKEESSFSLRKLLPGRRKKKVEKQLSSEMASGEEDSDTPAVVPLSEYDTEPKEPVTSDVAPVTVDEPVVTQTKVSAEERSPSWIPAITVAEDDDKQLSDIPEEAEAATPKSADTTVADDDVTQDPALMTPGSLDEGQKLSTAEELPVIPAPQDETTPVPEEPKSETAEMVLEPAAEQVNSIPCETSVPVPDVPVEEASTVTECEPPVEEAESETKAILESHLKGEAMAICTGLETEEIAKVVLEEPAVPTTECVTVISDALSAEVLQEVKEPPTEEATESEDPLLEAQVEQVDTTELEPEPEKIADEVPELQNAIEESEPEVEMATTVNALPEQSEILQPSELSENSPKIVLSDPIAPTVEAAVITEGIEVTEPEVEIKEKEMELEKLAATEKNAPVEEMAQVLSEEMTATLTDTTKSIITEVTEPQVAVMAAAEEVTVTKETVVLVAPLPAEPEQAETKEEVLMEQVSVSQSAGDEPIQVQETEEVSVGVATAVLDTNVEIAESTNESPIINDAPDETAVEEQTADTIEQQGMDIAQTVIRNVMIQVQEEANKPKKATTPTDTMPTPVQAIPTTEQEIETESEKPTVMDTPVAVVYEPPVTKPASPKPLHSAVEVTWSVPVEVLETGDVQEEVKIVKEIKQAVEVTVSDATVEEEEVVDIDAKSQQEEVKDIDAKSQEEVTVEVKSEESEVVEVPKEVEAEADPVEEKEATLPTQVVLQVAQVVEDACLEEEVVTELDSNGPVNDVTPAAATDRTVEETDSLQAPTSEEPQQEVSPEDAASTQEAPAAETEKIAAGKCAEVMAQVIEVIEEAVKEIEPVSTEITTTS